MPGQHVSREALVEAQKWRYATKVFNPAKQIPAGEWSALEESLILSPSSYGLQPWKFLVISDPAIRRQLRALSWNQAQVTDASHFVVFAGRTDVAAQDIERLIQAVGRIQHRDPAFLETYRGMMLGDLVNGPRHAMITEWVSRQVYIALGNFMTSAAMLGIDTCPMEGLDPVQYDAVLGLKAMGYATKVACAAGYRSAADTYALLPKVRYDRAALIHTV